MLEGGLASVGAIWCEVHHTYVGPSKPRCKRSTAAPTFAESDLVRVENVVHKVDKDRPIEVFLKSRHERVETFQEVTYSFHE